MDIGSLKADLMRSAGVCLTDAVFAPVGGGTISRCYRISSDRGPVFLKINRASALDLFEAEAQGLEALRAAAGARVPAVLGFGATPDTAYLALEWIEMRSRAGPAEARLGRGLARQHHVTSASFGWDRDNAIGPTRQLNARSERWLEFFRDRRLRFQLDLAATNGLAPAVLARGERLLERVGEILDAHAPVPSLLHGDLWSGNWGVTDTGEPVIFDPAVYFGDREADLAMTRLFGGFGAGFYEAYEAEWPLPRGWAERVDLYNLYHLLNHFNVFGTGYLEPVEAAIRRLESTGSGRRA